MNNAVQAVLRITAPVGIIVYGAGLYLLVKLSRKRKTYINYISLIDESIVAQFSKQ